MDKEDHSFRMPRFQRNSPSLTEPNVELKKAMNLNKYRNMIDIIATTPELV